MRISFSFVRFVYLAVEEECKENIQHNTLVSMNRPTILYHYLFMYKKLMIHKHFLVSRLSHTKFCFNLLDVYLGAIKIFRVGVFIDEIVYRGCQNYRPPSYEHKKIFILFQQRTKLIC
jgi:hypothetical protein